MSEQHKYLSSNYYSQSDTTQSTVPLKVSFHCSSSELPYTGINLKQTQTLSQWKSKVDWHIDQEPTYSSGAIA